MQQKAWGIPLSEQAAAYVPEDYLERAATHEVHAGGSAEWPAPLTRVGQDRGVLLDPLTDTGPAPRARAAGRR